MLTLSIFVLALLVRVNLASIFVCRNGKYETAYDTSTHICCNNTVTSKLNSENSLSIECCNDQPYDTRQNLCCDDVLHTAISPDSYNCIGKNYQPNPADFLTNSHLNRTVLKDNYATKENQLVCGAVNKFLYNPDQQMCCNGTIYPLNSYILCCSDTVYNKTTQFCCGGQLRPRSVLKESVECCGTSPYNSEDSLCCNGRLYEHKNPNKFSCCGSKPYTVYEDMCCKSEVYKWSNKSLCCENLTYNRDLQYCLNDREILNLNESKCNGVIYDTTKKVCCGGTTLHPHNISQRCCGSEIFDRRSNDCVNDHIVTKNKSWCDPVGEYDTSTHACCESHLKVINGTSRRCCGQEVIDYDVENCCGGKRFDKRNHRCCSGKIIQMEDICCSGQILNQTTDLCCGKTLFRREQIVQKRAPYHDKCCPGLNGGVSYDSVNSVCTYGNRVVNKSIMGRRCGNETYNPQKDRCCNSKLFKNAMKDGKSCCDPSASIYNPKTHVCCLGKRKRGKSCKTLKNRLRCPRRCKKMNLKKYCKRFLSKTGHFKIIKKRRRQLKSIKHSNSCRCVYAKRRKKSCKNKRCVLFQRLIGISEEKMNTFTFYIKRNGIKFLKRECPQAMSTKKGRTP